MSTLRVISKPAAVAKLIMAGGVVVKASCQAPAVVKFVSVGTQGIQGLAGMPERAEPKTGFGTGEASFELDHLPAVPASVRMFINGTAYRAPESFTLNAQQISWLGEFTIEDSDEVEFRYSI